MRRLFALCLALSVLCLAACALSGALVYFLAAAALGLQEARLALTLLKRIGKRG